MIKNVFDPVIGAINTSLNLRTVKANVINSNIANANTPGYKAQAVEFEGALREALGADETKLKMKKTNRKHFGPSDTDPVDVEIYDDPFAEPSLDGNTVHKERQMIDLVENQTMYNSAVELLKRKIALVKYVVSEGGGNR